MADANPIVLFDGACNLCNASVRWVLARDRRGVFRFASLQSVAARRILQQAGVSPAAIDALPDSMVLVEGTRVWTKSDAALATADRLGWPWKALLVCKALPKGLRDGIYAWIARNRYRWFGKSAACMMPDEDVRDRFVE